MEPRYWEVFVDPHSGAMLGARERDRFVFDKRHLIPCLYKFHYTLYADEFGEWLMGIVALLWLLDHFVAAWLSFPSLKAWRKSFRVRWRAGGGYRLNFDLHRAGGLYAWVVLFVVALSGVYFNLHEPFKAVVAWFSPLTPWYEEVAPKLPMPLETPTLTFEEAVDIATRARPGDQFNSWCIDSKTNLGCVRVAS
jgi:uncharacterized iron-regulated membrane protein